MGCAAIRKVEPMAKANGRRPGYKHNARSRDAIKTTTLLNKLMNHIMSEDGTLSQSQVTAAKILLAKVLPDMSQIDATVDQRVEMTNEELDARIESLTGAPGGTVRTTH